MTREVYEALVDTFRKEAHAQEMRDIRHTTKDGYTEGETEDLVELTGESEMCIRDRGTGRGSKYTGSGNGTADGRFILGIAHLDQSQTV